jgi:hypothetical protein
MMRLVVGISLFLTLAAFAQSSANLPPLPNLSTDCSLEIRTISVSETALFLKCSGISFRVYHAKNLYGRLAIANREEALQFVRFFTSRRTFFLLGMNGDVEVRDSKEQSMDFWLLAIASG